MIYGNTGVARWVKPPPQKKFTKKASKESGTAHSYNLSPPPKKKIPLYLSQCTSVKLSSEPD